MSRGEAMGYMFCHPWFLCFIVAFTGILCGGLNIQSSMATADYIPRDGEVRFVGTSQVLLHGTKQTRLDYEVTWEADGEEYTYDLYEQMDRHETGPQTIWVNKDNDKIRLYPIDEVKESGYTFLFSGIGAGLLGVMLLWIQLSMKKKKKVR